VFHLFQTYVASVLDVAHVSHICCKNMFQMFQLFQSYVAVHVFMVASCKLFDVVLFHTHVASGCSKCFIRFIRMLHSNVSCCTCFILFGELMGAGSDGGTA
jgi:hypothetical protein